MSCFPDIFFNKCLKSITLININGIIINNIPIVPVSDANCKYELCGCVEQNL